MPQHLNVIVHGVVQTVGFRYNTEQLANKLGIKGFVRNEPSGQVYLEVEGAEPALQELLDWCRRGPAWARVDKIDVEPGTLKNFTDFRITY